MTAVPVDAGPDRVARSVVVDAAADALFDIVADPRRHHELDGSGSVGANVAGPPRLGPGMAFTTSMRMYGFPYRITSRVTEFDDGRVVEWQHPFGHRWRWEFEPLTDSTTRVIETFDYSGGARVGLRLLRYPAKNATGIEATLNRLVERFAPPAPPF